MLSLGKHVRPFTLAMSRSQARREPTVPSL